MKKRNRTASKMITFITVLSIIIAQMTVPACAMAASDFTDLTVDYWGYPYIDFAAASGIINGYQSYDGSYQFLPEKALTKEESVTMLYRVLSSAGKLESTDDFTEEYSDLLTGNMVADWAKKYVAYGLKYELIAVSELADFTDLSGAGIAAPREQVAMWTAKAMGKKLSPAYSLSYTDKDGITNGMLPYVDLLYRQGIMRGDDTKMFHPSGSIKRSEFAAISKRVFEAEQNDIYVEANEIQSYRGTIVSVDAYNSRIMMTQSDGTARVIQLDPKTQIVINGKVNYNGLAGIGTGTAAVVAWGAFYDENEPKDGVLQLHVISETQTMTGLLTKILKMDDNTSILEIENEDGDTIYYVLDADSKADGTPKKGTEVTFIADGVKILEMK
jgi:hypothetical protein